MVNEEFSLIAVGNGAILFDLKSAAVFELNEAAAFVWARRLNGDPPEVIGTALALQYSLDPQVAFDDVRTALSLDAAEAGEQEGDYRYLKAELGYSFFHNGQLIFQVDESGRRVRLNSEFDGSQEALRAFLRALTPKIIALRGGAVIHASAVELAGKVVAFSGPSGAGKTTTARFAANAGARLISEDQVLLRTAGDSVHVATGAELLITSWVHEAAGTLLTSRDVTCDALDTMDQCESLLLEEIGFVDLTHRSGEEYASRQLKGWETAALVFKNSFYGSDRHDDWHRHLEIAARLGSTVSGFQLALPDGLERLAEVMKQVTRSGSLRS